MTVFNDPHVVPGLFKRRRNEAGIDGGEVPMRVGSPPKKLHQAASLLGSRKVFSRQLRLGLANGPVGGKPIQGCDCANPGFRGGCKHRNPGAQRAQHSHQRRAAGVVLGPTQLEVAFAQVYLVDDGKLVVGPHAKSAASA